MTETYAPLLSPLLKPYPTYKASGVSWLRQPPAHWNRARLKSCTRNVVDLTRALSRDDIYLALENVESWTGRFSAVGDDVDFDSQVKRFRVGDVLFGKLRPLPGEGDLPKPQRSVRWRILSAQT